MAVEIELELDASQALGEIGAVSLALENLDKRFDDLGELELELGEIGDEIRDLVSALEEVEFNLNNIADDINEAVQNLDGAEVSVDAPDGSTGAGDSTGNDPPGTTADGGGFPFMSAARRRQRYGDLIGIDSKILPKEFLNEFKENFAGYAKGRTMHLGSDLKDAPYTDPKFHYGESDFGVEPDSMSIKRRQELDPSELADIHGLDIGGGDDTSAFQKGRNIFSGDIAENLDQLDKPLQGLTKRLRKLKPTMGKYMQLLAALAPMMAAFGTQAAGVAASLGGVAAAGAAVMGLGLLGHAESMAGAFQQAKIEIQDFKSDLFEVFQPAMQEFAPIQSQFFDWAPGQLRGVADALKGLTAYEDTFYQIFATATRTAEDLVQVLVRNEEIISAMATRSLNLVGSGLVKFFRWLVQTAYENWGVMMDLWKVFESLLAVLYNLSMFVARLVTNFQPLFNLIVRISGLLNNDLAAGVVTMIALMYGLQKAALMGATALGLLTNNVALFGGTSLISSVAGGIKFITGMLYELVAAAWSANWALGVLAGIATGGLALLGGSIAATAIGDMMGGGGGPPTGGGLGGGGGGPGGRGKTVVYNDNRSYSIEAGGESSGVQQERIVDAVGEVNGTVSQMQTPSPGTTSSSSTTGRGNGGNSGGQGNS